ncbi:MAG: hypothetical protein LC657_19335, partial [Desulfobacteraceae bacterium]|nr:hypothetical protein [Desulfobacteraceae bacterium]
MNTRYYQVGGFTIQVHSELPITEDTFHPKLKIFEVDGPGEQDNIVINHYFARKSPVEATEKQRIYFKQPWAIFEKEDRILYEWLSSDKQLDGDSGVMRKIAANRQ